MKSAHKISTADGVQLDALLIEPDDGAVKAVVMVNSGAAIRKEFYRQFAEYLAAHGYAAVLYDYRGIGGSRPSSWRGFKASLRDWGEKDMVGVMDWIEHRYPGRPKFILAHSLGGQLIGLMSNHALIDGVFMVATSIGYWRLMTGRFRYYCAAMWYLYIPVTALLLGYVPLRIIGQGEDLPAGVAREWAGWCRRRDYLSGSSGRKIDRSGYDALRVPIRAVGFSDDEIANELTIPAMLDYYRNAPVETTVFRPSSINRSRIGHFGFFLFRNKDPLWRIAVDWLEQCLRARGKDRFPSG